MPDVSGHNLSPTRNYDARVARFQERAAFADTVRAYLQEALKERGHLLDYHWIRKADWDRVKGELEGAPGPSPFWWEYVKKKWLKE